MLRTRGSGIIRPPERGRLALTERLNAESAPPGSSQQLFASPRAGTACTGPGVSGLPSLLLDSREGAPKRRTPRPLADCVIQGAADPALRTTAEAAVENHLHRAAAVAGTGAKLPRAIALKDVGVEHRCLDGSRLGPLVPAALPEQPDDPGALGYFCEVLAAVMHLEMLCAHVWPHVCRRGEKSRAA